MAGIMMKVLCLVVAFMIVSTPYVDAHISCGLVVSKLAPCLNYLKGGGSVPASCCKGVQGLNIAANTTPDRKTACKCMKNAYKLNPGINSGIAAGLPEKCGVDIPYKISLNTDCNKVK